MGRGHNMQMLTVKAVIDNPAIPVYQYSFEEVDYKCGEQSLRSEPDGPDLKISDCPKDTSEDDFEFDSNAARINTASMMLRSPIDLGEAGIANIMPGNIFFKPSFEMVKWIKNYAGDRLIMDIGAGQGHLVRMLKKVGAKAMGIEPNYDPEMHRNYLLSKGIFPDPNEMLPWTVFDAKKLIGDLGSRALFIFARPCHSDFVEEGLGYMQKGSEALYITVPGNMEEYNDLGRFRSKAKQIQHEGVSEDNEIVYSVKL